MNYHKESHLTNIRLLLFLTTTDRTTLKNLLSSKDRNWLGEEERLNKEHLQAVREVLGFCMKVKRQETNIVYSENLNVSFRLE